MSTEKEVDSNVQVREDDTASLVVNWTAEEEAKAKRK